MINENNISSSNQKSGLKMAHINAQSLNNKMDELRHTFIKTEIDIICVSESWFYPDNDNIYSATGYKMVVVL